MSTPIQWPSIPVGSGTGTTYTSPNGAVWTWIGYAWEGEVLQGSTIVGGQYNKELISGGSIWSTGMTFDVSQLTYTFYGPIQTTEGATSITLSNGDPTFDRIDAIVVSDDDPYGIVSVITGNPAANPATPEIPNDQLLVQYILVGTGVTAFPATQDIIYNENVEWNGSIVDSTSPIGTVDFNSTSPTPPVGSKCIKVTNNNRRRWIRFTRASSIASSDYTSVSLRIYFPSTMPGTRRLYLRFRSGVGYSGNGVYVNPTFASGSITGSWQTVVIPLYIFNITGNIDGLDVQLTGRNNTDVRDWAVDSIRLQGGFDAPQVTSGNSINIYNSNGSLLSNRLIDLSGYQLELNGNTNSKIIQGIGTRELRIDSNGIQINQAYRLPNTDGTSGQVMTTNGSGQLTFSTPIGGSGTTNYIPRWSNSTTLSTTSRIWDNGTFVGIGTTAQSGSETLRITGITRIDDALGYFRFNAGDITYENTITSSNLNVLSSGGGVSISTVNIVGATSGWGRISYGKTGNTQKLDFYNNLTAAAVMTLTSASNVGIGTASPSAKLHVVAASNNASVLVLDGLNDLAIHGENISITKQADVTTTLSSSSVVSSTALASTKKMVCQGRFIAAGTTVNGITVGGSFMFVAENVGGTITIVGSDVSLKEDSAGTPTVTFDGLLGNVRIIATGGGEDLSWLFTYTYEIISPPPS
jgi:hypothetical protein